MDKRINGDKILLFKKDNNRYYLRKPHFDCGWYWGLGYLATGRGSHGHFDDYFKDKPFYNAWIDFDDTPFTKEESYIITDYMRQLYRLRKMANMLYCGNTNVTDDATVLEQFRESNMAEYKRINNVLIPTVWNALVDVLLDEEEDREQAYIPVKQLVVKYEYV
jgi:hypothetical protein